MLDPTASLSEVRQLAAKSPSAFHIGERTLGKLLHEKGLLMDRGKDHYTVKRRVLGAQYRVLELHADKVLQDPTTGGDFVTQEELSKMLLP